MATKSRAARSAPNPTNLHSEPAMCAALAATAAACRLTRAAARVLADGRTHAVRATACQIRGSVGRLQASLGAGDSRAARSPLAMQVSAQRERFDYDVPDRKDLYASVLSPHAVFSLRPLAVRRILLLPTLLLPTPNTTTTNTAAPPPTTTTAPPTSPPPPPPTTAATTLLRRRRAPRCPRCLDCASRARNCCTSRCASDLAMGGPTSRRAAFSSSTGPSTHSTLSPKREPDPSPSLRAAPSALQRW